MALVHIQDLREGMVLHCAIYNPESQKLLLKEGHILNHQNIKSLKKKNIPYVDIKDEHTLLLTPYDVIYKDLVHQLETELFTIAPDYKGANKSDYILEISKQCKDIIHSILSDVRIVDYCTQMRILNKKQLYDHSIGVCILSLLIAGVLNLHSSQMRNIGIAALLHDIGLSEMPFLIGSTHRTPQEDSLYREHPTYGYYFVKEAGYNEEIADIIHYHHERFDGNGYPQQKKGIDIPIGARIVSICDKYDSLIRNHGHSNHDAIEYLYGNCNSHFETHIVETFVNHIAVYPIGSMVRLSTGEIGIVVNVRKNLGARPIIRVYYNRVNRPLTSPRDVDLGKERTLFITQII